MAHVRVLSLRVRIEPGEGLRDCTAFCVSDCADFDAHGPFHAAWHALLRIECDYEYAPCYEPVYATTDGQVANLHRALLESALWAHAE